MTMLRWSALVPLLISAIIMVGCAKRPATTQASAPAPLGAAGAGARTAGDAGQSSGTSAADGAGAADARAADGAGAAAGARSAQSGDAAGGSDAGAAQAGTGAGGDRGSAATGSTATGAGERGAIAGGDGSDGSGDSTRADTRAGRDDAAGGSDGRAAGARGSAAGEGGDGRAGTGPAQGSSESTTQIATAAGAGGAAQGDGAAGAMMAEARPEVREFVPIPDLGDVHFDFDRYDIRPEDARVLDANAEWLKANPDRLLLIEGHCDERGTNEYNLALGEHRAKSAMNYLISQGVQSGRMTIISYGEERPACTDKSESCWLANRRAHFLVKSH